MADTRDSALYFRSSFPSRLHCCFEEVNYLFKCFLCWKPGANYWEVLKKVWQKKRYNADLRGTHNFLICSWVFPLGYTEDKWLVNCGYLPGDCRIIHGIRYDFICSEDEAGLLEVIADTFISMEVILFKWLSLISLILFSNVFQVQMLLL